MTSEFSCVQIQTKAKTYSWYSWNWIAIQSNDSWSFDGKEIWTFSKENSSGLDSYYAYDLEKTLHILINSQPYIWYMHI